MRFWQHLTVMGACGLVLAACGDDSSGGCIGQGYLVGKDPDADKKSKETQLKFMTRVFGL